MSWIWLPETSYPEEQNNFSNTNSACDEIKGRFPYCVGEFVRQYSFGKKITKAELTVSADNCFHLYANGSFIGRGPALPGGDFLCRRPAPKHYAEAYTLTPETDTLSLSALVRLLPEKVCDYSRNHGGFMLFGTVFFEDGTSAAIQTDEAWLCRKASSYTDSLTFDSSVPERAFESARCVPDVWSAEPSRIPALDFETVCDKSYTLTPGQKTEDILDLERIWGAYPVLVSDGKCRITLETSELEGQNITTEKVRFAAAGKYHSFCMHSVGYVKMTAENDSDAPVTLSLRLLASHYPVTAEGSFTCSDEGFNKVYDVCKHTLKICRQSIHLDSPKHQELLACTGDYYIDMLMTKYMFGDMRLSEFDLVRTADWLTANGGRMFHTTYSLIWVQMLHDCYLFTGNIQLLRDCEIALEALFARFETYFGTSGVIEYPPDFMFVDWTVVDGYSMHHPPKALGQTVLNAFYYEALNKAAKIYEALGKAEKAGAYKQKSAEFKRNFNREFFDSDKKLYFDGKNDVYGGFAHYLPDNSEKRYYTKYPDILACAYGLQDGEEAVDLLERVIFNDAMQDIQPYFMSYLLKAVYRLGLFGKYGLKLMERWKPVVYECDKGLKEGWIAPQPDYSFDHSHSWGGIVGYYLPEALLNMKILTPGMKKLSFSPELYGLTFADISFPTPFGTVKVCLKKGEEPVITVPDGIEIV